MLLKTKISIHHKDLITPLTLHRNICALMLQKSFSFFILFILGTSLSYSQIQWATRLLSYSSQQGEKAYSAKQVLGPPSKLPAYGDCGCAWTTLFPDNYEEEFVRVAFPKKINVQRIFVSENYNGGAVKAIYLYDQYNLPHLVYERTKIEGSYGRLLVFDIPKTTFLTNELKLVLETESITGYNQIDAIGIASEKIEYTMPTVRQTDYFQFLSKAQNMGTSVNSVGSDLAPVLSDDGKRLYFTRKDHPQNTGGLLNDDIWYANLIDGNAGAAINPGAPINNELNNFVIGVHNGGEMLSLANHYYPDGHSGMGVSQSWQNGTDWRYPMNLITPGLVSYNFYSEYFMNADRSVMLISLEKGDGLGMKDIYVSFSENQLTWTVPKNLGPGINTTSDEMAPSLSPDGRYLIFSSNGLPGYGEQDIYISKRLDDTWTNWSVPANMGPEINDAGFDAYFTFNDSSEYAYFTSTRESYFNPDIYRIRIKANEEKKEDTVPEVKREVEIIIPDEKLPEVLPDGLELHDDILLFGTIFDVSTEKPVNAKLIFELVDYPSTPDTISTLNNNYRRKITDQIKYKVVVEKEGYLYYEQEVQVLEVNQQRVKRVDFRIVPIEKGKSFVLEKLNFNANSYIIRRESYTEVDGLVLFMLRNPSISIEIGGHTNGLCDDDFCNTLSQQRAESVRNYLIQKGVAADRVTAKGYGKTRPVSTNDTPEGRSLNQRVEITIL